MYVKYKKKYVKNVFFGQNYRGVMLSTFYKNPNLFEINRKILT